ncbi:winged helix-turn-helix domain-containing protein [Vibrio vulnificus]|uniref:winged helix-turn-helix domain-containing protein n=1 Tax=Vibrio vulnificus TaxID=672 RepID=UPI001029648A|nr:winged helix-turn-helix domain-containing protein [Vibrio vulnificus]RZP61089.1 hypothetical protein D8T47_13745 [Vibrio vulnificus]
MPQRKYCFSGLTLDSASRRLANEGGHWVVLRPMPCKVLVELLLNSGVCVTRDELFDRCWSGAIVSEEALTNVVSVLRREISRLSSDGVRIQTISKQGYILFAGDVRVVDIGVEIPPLSIKDSHVSQYRKQGYETPDVYEEPIGSEGIKNKVRSVFEGAPVRLKKRSYLMVALIVTVVFFVLVFPRYTNGTTPFILDERGYKRVSAAGYDYFIYDSGNVLDLVELQQYLMRDRWNEKCKGSKYYIRVFPSTFEKKTYALKLYYFDQRQRSINYTYFDVKRDSALSKVLNAVSLMDSLCKGL